MGDLRLFTYREVASHFRVSERTVRTWASKGAIDVVRTPSGRPRVRLDAEEGGSSGACTIEPPLLVPDNTV